MKTMKRGVVHITDGPCTPCTIFAILLIVMIPLGFYVAKEYGMKVTPTQSKPGIEGYGQRQLPVVKSIEKVQSPLSKGQGAVSYQQISMILRDVS